MQPAKERNTRMTAPRQVARKDSVVKVQRGPGIVPSSPNYFTLITVDENTHVLNLSYNVA